MRNLRHNSHVSLALDNFGHDNTPVVVEGIGALIDEPDINFMMPAYAAKYAALSQRAGVTLEHLSRIYTQAIRITPSRIRQDE